MNHWIIRNLHFTVSNSHEVVQFLLILVDKKEVATGHD